MWFAGAKLETIKTELGTYVPPTLLELSPTFQPHMGRHQIDDVDDDFLSTSVTNIEKNHSPIEYDEEDRPKFMTPMKRVQSPRISYAKAVTPTTDAKPSPPKQTQHRAASPVNPDFVKRL